MKKCFLALLGLGASVAVCSADVVYVTSMTSNCTSTTVCGNGANPDLNINGENVFSEIGGAFTAALCTTPDKPKNAGGARYYSTTFTNAASNLQGITLRPTLGVTGGVYKVYHVFSSTAANVTLDAILGVTNDAGCTLSFTETDKFQRSYGTPAPQQWQVLGFLTNNADTSTPTITFYYKSGVVTATGGNRLVVDTFRFSLYNPCLDVATVGITGPLATNSSTVIVTAVTNATAVTVYQDSGSGFVQIGQLTTGVVDGNNAVPVTGLVKGAAVAATQTVGGQEGCAPTAGFIVGGGANPSVRIALNVRENTALTGPVGAAGSGSIVHMIGTSTLLSGGAPEQGIVLQPSTSWQTISFTNNVDPLVTWAGTDASPGTWDGPYGAVDGLAIACEGDSGPFDIYIDDMENGTHGVFQNWEGAAVGAQAYGFSQPSFSGSTGGNLLGAPNVAQVVNTTASGGTKSLRVTFQYNSDSINKWLRLVTSGATPVANPQVDVNEPVSFKILLLPPGAALPQPPAPGSLSLSRVGTDVVLNWTGSYPLQSSTNVTGTYVDVGVVTGPYTNSATATDKYFRLRGN